VFIEAKDDGSAGDNWSYKLCKALVKLSPPTIYHATEEGKISHRAGDNTNIMQLNNETIH